MSTNKRDFVSEEFEDYDSHFGDEEEEDEAKKSKKLTDLDVVKKQPPHYKPPDGSLPSKSFFESEKRRVESFKNSYFSLNAYERHKKLVTDYMHYYPQSSTNNPFGRDTSKDKNDGDVIRENHRFIWEEDERESMSWEKDLAKKYYDKLFKEYGLCDLSRYKENKVAIRWRVEKEVVDGKGQFICGEKKCIKSGDDEELRTWEVNFTYLEENKKKNALVKLRLCEECSAKLNFSYKRKEVTKKSKKRTSCDKSTKKSKRKRNETSSSSTTSYEPNGILNTNEISTGEVEVGSGGNIWKEGIKNVPELKSREDEFNDYLHDLFL